MNYTRVSVLVGALIVSGATTIPALGAYGVQQPYRGYPMHQTYGAYGVQQPYRGYPVHQAYGASRVQQFRRGYRPHAADSRAAYRRDRRVGGGYGLATFYDPGWRGRGFTAAHLSLPMGTQVRVTNLSNRHSVVVRIADRGPEAWTGRVLDLSRTAARSLGMIQAGVVPVAYQIVN